MNIRTRIASALRSAANVIDPSRTAESKRLGMRLKAYRESRRWTQYQLAKKLGVSQTRISRYENGYPVPRRVELLFERVIADAHIVQQPAASEAAA